MSEDPSSKSNSNSPSGSDKRSSVSHSNSISTSTTTSTSSSSDDEEEEEEEFFDAEEPHTGTLLRYSRKILMDNPPVRPDLSIMTAAEIDSLSSNQELFFVTPPSAVESRSLSLLSKSELEEQAEDEKRQKRLEEMRRRLNNEEIEDGGPPDDQTSPSDSQTSSVEGLYGAISGKTSHPFKVVDHDSISLQSGVSMGGRAGMGGGRVSTNSNAYTSVGGGVAFQHLSSQSHPHPPSSVGVAAPGSPSTSSVNSNKNSPLTGQLASSSSESDLPVVQPSSSSSSKQIPVLRRNASGGDMPVGMGRHSKHPEPDLVASCVTKDGKIIKSSVSPVPPPLPGGNPLATCPPVAPPRRRKQGLAQDKSEEDNDQIVPLPTTSQPPMTSGPPSPTVSIRSVCRDLDRTLLEQGNTPSCSNRIYVVKAQDEEKTRAKNSGPKVLRRTESLPKDVIAAFDPSGSGSGGIRSATSTGAGGEPPEDNIKRGSLSSSIKSKSSSGSNTNSNNSRSNSAPKSGSPQLSTIVSAMAAMEEKKELSVSASQSSENNNNSSHNQLHHIHLSASKQDSCPPGFNMIRTRTDSGKLLTDIEILEQVQVLNLDTGEKIPLSVAEDKIPKCINPLSLHIMRLTSEYMGGEKDSEDRDSDEESLDSKMSSAASQEDYYGDVSKVRKKTAQVKRFFNQSIRKTVDKAKSFAHRSRHHKEDHDISTNADQDVPGQEPPVKMKAAHSHKGPYDFDQLQQVQELSNGEHGHSGPIWCMKFSNCGKLLATAGQDKVIRIWVLRDHLPYFQDMRTKNTGDKSSPTPSQESVVSQHSQHSAEEMAQACENSDPKAPFVPRPLCTYSGHTADLLDIAWSKSFFLLSSSMDRTVRLWHISRRECLCCFQHIDFVTAIAFHPRDDRYFLSGSLDGKLRLWNIPDKKVALWNEVNGPNKLITAANFCQNGKFAVVGTYDGNCIFYHTEQLKYHTQIVVHRKKRMTGKKITGIEPMPGEDKILVTSNDSRIRMYDLRDLSLSCKYKGFTNSSSQIKGTVSHDGKYIVSGSENQCVYIWKAYHDYSKFGSARKDRNGYWEGIKAHNAVVTCAAFSPDPDIIAKQIENSERKVNPDDDKQEGNGHMVKSPSLLKSYSQQHGPSTTPAGYALVSADFSGCIKVFFSRVKPKHSSLPASALI